MNYRKSLLFVSLFVTYSINFSASFNSEKDIHKQIQEEMQENFAQLHKDLEHMHQEIMQKLEKEKSALIDTSQLPLISINDSEEANTILIIIQEIESAHWKLTKHYNPQSYLTGITISIQAGNNTLVTVDYQQLNHILDATITCQMQQEKQKGKVEMQQVSYNKTAHQMWTLHDEIDLDKVEIAYNATEQIVTINMPKMSDREIETENTEMESHNPF